jgi:glucose-1-phosphatase
MAITHIVCDMGGVLVELQWLDRVKDLLGKPMAIDELHTTFLNNSTSYF